MAREYIVLEAVPSEEDPADIDQRGYAALARQRCAAFIAQLRRTFGPEPQGASLQVRPMPHDAGTYYTVVCYYDNPEGEEYALRLEGNLPEYWDEEARKELGLPAREG